MKVKLYLFFGLIFFFTSLCQSLPEENWDLLYLLKSEKHIQLTDDVTLRLTSKTNYSQLFLSAKQLFHNNNLPRTFIIFVKLQLQEKLTKPVILLSLKDPNSETRFQLSFKTIPKIIDKIELNVFYNPLPKMDHGISKDFILPFMQMDIWKFSLLFQEEKIILYTSCDDIKQPYGYQSFQIPRNFGEKLCSDGAIVHLFSEDHGMKSLQGEIHELSFSNSLSKLKDLCNPINLEGSGSESFKMGTNMPGNHILNTEVMDDEDPTTTTEAFTDPAVEMKSLGTLMHSKIPNLENTKKRSLINEEKLEAKTSEEYSDIELSLSSKKSSIKIKNVSKNVNKVPHKKNLFQNKNFEDDQVSKKPDLDPNKYLNILDEISTTSRDIREAEYTNSNSQTTQSETQSETFKTTLKGIFVNDEKTKTSKNTQTSSGTTFNISALYSTSKPVSDSSSSVVNKNSPQSATKNGNSEGIISLSEVTNTSNRVSGETILTLQPTTSVNKVKANNEKIIQETKTNKGNDSKITKTVQTSTSNESNPDQKYISSEIDETRVVTTQTTQTTQRLDDVGKITEDGQTITTSQPFTETPYSTQQTSTTTDEKKDDNDFEKEFSLPPEKLINVAKLNIPEEKRISTTSFVPVISKTYQSKEKDFVDKDVNKALKSSTVQENNIQNGKYRNENRDRELNTTTDKNNLKTIGKKVGQSTLIFNFETTKSSANKLQTTPSISSTEATEGVRKEENILLNYTTIDFLSSSTPLSSTLSEFESSTDQKLYNASSVANKNITKTVTSTKGYRNDSSFTTMSQDSTTSSKGHTISSYATFNKTESYEDFLNKTSRTEPVTEIMSTPLKDNKTQSVKNDSSKIDRIKLEDKEISKAFEETKFNKSERENRTEKIQTTTPNLNLSAEIVNETSTTLSPTTSGSTKKPRPRSFDVKDKIVTQKEISSARYTDSSVKPKSDDTFSSTTKFPYSKSENTAYQNTTENAKDLNSTAIYSKMGNTSELAKSDKTRYSSTLETAIDPIASTTPLTVHMTTTETSNKENIYSTTPQLDDKIIDSTSKTSVTKNIYSAGKSSDDYSSKNYSKSTDPENTITHTNATTEPISSTKRFLNISSQTADTTRVSTSDPKKIKVTESSKTRQQTNATKTEKTCVIAYGDQSNQSKKLETEKKKESTDLPQVDKENYCDILSKLRVPIPQKGEKGERGFKGAKGDQGIPGSPGVDGRCDAKACRFDFVIKGEKGDSGVCDQNKCLASKGEKGLPGPRGELGLKGEKGEGDLINIDLLKHLTISILNSEMETLGLSRNIKGEKGEQGKCKCNQQRQSSYYSSLDQFDETLNIGHGSIVFESKENLEQISSKLPLGSMAYILKNGVFLVKIDQGNNAWRSITLDSKFKDWVLPIPIRTSSPQMTRPPFVSDGRQKLHVIALPLPTMGDLKPMIRHPGGYSGATFQCQQSGAMYGFGRSFHPFINTDAFNIKYIIKSIYKNIGIYNTRGELLANNYLSFLSENEDLQSEILDFKKNAISSNILSPCVWVGKEPVLNDFEYEKNSHAKCLNWMSRDPEINGLVSMVVAQKSLFNENNKQMRSCSQQCHILCIQTEPFES